MIVRTEENFSEAQHFPRAIPKVHRPAWWIHRMTLRRYDPVLCIKAQMDCHGIANPGAPSAGASRHNRHLGRPCWGRSVRKRGIDSTRTANNAFDLVLRHALPNLQEVGFSDIPAFVSLEEVSCRGIPARPPQRADPTGSEQDEQTQQPGYPSRFPSDSPLEPGNVPAGYPRHFALLGLSRGSTVNPLSAPSRESSVAAILSGSYGQPQVRRSPPSRTGS
jgi:hypothetical protein